MHSTELDLAELMRTVQRCAEAYHLVMADRPQNPDVWQRQEFQEKSFLAFAAHLPILTDLQSIRTYIACIGDRAPGGPHYPEAEGMNYLELATGHDAMISAPRPLADMLLGLA